jgi:hypothetical protein
LALNRPSPFSMNGAISAVPSSVADIELEHIES